MGRLLDALELKMKEQSIMSNILSPEEIFAGEPRTYISSPSIDLTGFTPIKGRKRLSKKKRKVLKKSRKK